MVSGNFTGERENLTEQQENNDQGVIFFTTSCRSRIRGVGLEVVLRLSEVSLVICWLSKGC